MEEETPLSGLSFSRSWVRSTTEQDHRNDEVVEQAHEKCGERHLGPEESAAKRRAKLERSLASLARFPRFNLSDPILQKYAMAIDTYLAPWHPIAGVRKGMGSGHGMVSPAILHAMATRAGFMSCCGQVRIVRGKVFFRYGGFLKTWYGTRRFVLTLKAIQLAIRRYGLQAVSAEFFLNTCDQPISLDNAKAKSRGGYPVFSTQWWPGTVDILYPDPLDLDESYMSQATVNVPWEKRKVQAVFRGSSTNYNINNDTNWRASPRFRLHKMSEARPDLLDCSITGWSHVADPKTYELMAEDGVTLGQRLSRGDLENYRFEIVADGGGGSSRTCGVLSSDRVMIKQDSIYNQFYQALLKPFVHYVPTKHSFEDLYDQVQWLQRHGAEALHILRRAHKMARHACTRRGRALYWAALLVKYSLEAMDRTEGLEAPRKLCSHRPPVRSMRRWVTQEDTRAQVPEGWPSTCEGVGDVKQPECAFFCAGPGFVEHRPVWVGMESLEHIVPTEV